MKIGLLESNIYPLPSPPDVISAPLDIVGDLANGLHKREGVEVTLFASDDSKSDAKLFSAGLESLYKKNHNKGGFHLNTVSDVQTAAAYENILTATAYRHAIDNGFDIIHSHPLGRTLPFSTIAPLPTIYTLHIPLASLNFDGRKEESYLDFQLFTLEKLAKMHGNYFVSISDAQRRAAPELPYAATVYNGINVDQFDYSPEPGRYLAMLGRIVEEKGYDHGIAVAQISQTPLKIAGQPSTSRPQYWETKVKPGIDGQLITYEGIVKGPDKAAFLKNALAVLFPIQWEEPFGMVMIEAMASGTPVIAYDRGSVREVIKDGETGFICSPNDQKAIVDAINKLKGMSESEHRAMRERCRRHVTENFSVDKMVSGYLAAYEKVIQDYRAG
jgi:glycosyltransferase involved in cell wall biosynthesis